MATDKEYMRVYMLERYKRRRAAAIEQLGGKCAKCDVTEGLEIDHIDPSNKSFTLAKGLSGWSEKRIQEELKKCQLLCEKHHIEKSIEDAGYNTRTMHGTTAGYTHGRCRCRLCKDAHNARCREWKRKKRAEKKIA